MLEQVQLGTLYAACSTAHQPAVPCQVCQATLCNKRMLPLPTLLQEMLGAEPGLPLPQPAPQPRQPLQPPAPATLHLRPGCPLLPLGQEARARCRPPAGRRFSPWERQSRPLTVNAEARAAFRQLLPWVECEAAALGDATLEQEVALLRTLAGAS